uniref:Uncharacterized protein n=1 Tax=Branchiostoma floridae TaxID=7739 RepID=C3YRP8_BRAFL|eukprot:XP_002600791.1 hypothetical protein BRAFLDRAFT_95077 [Branchiostoma floridae]
MGVIAVTFLALGCAALLSASSSAETNQKQAEAVHLLENRLLQILEELDDKTQQQDVDERVDTGGEEDALSIRGQPEDVLTRKQGCEGHQTGDQWGSSDHGNCICEAPDRLCYHVDCLLGSKIAKDSNDLWACEVVSSKRGITGSAVAMDKGMEQFTGREIFSIATGVFGVVSAIVGFTVDRIESAQTTDQLNEIQDQIRQLDRKVDELAQSVSDLQLGQEYLQQVILYGRDEMRLRNMLDTQAKMQISNGLYELPGKNVQAWADSVLSHGSDGVDQVLYNLLDMVKPHSGVFGGKSLMEICHLRLINGDNRDKYTEKMQQKAAQIYGLIGGGYSVWITALRIKGRASDIPAKTEEMKSELNTVGTSLLEYTKPKNWRTDWHCGSAYPADNGEAAKCHPDSKFPCCSPHNWCGNTADHCSCSGCVDYRAPQGKDQLARDVGLWFEDLKNVMGDRAVWKEKVDLVRASSPR